MSPTIKAAFWMVGAILSFTTMAIAGRQLGGILDTFEIMLYRSLTGLPIVLVIATLTGSIATVGTSKAGAHLVRNVFHFTGQNLWFAAIALIPLAQVFALEFTSPIWAMLLTPLILRERLTAMNLLAGAIGFAGILLVTRPSASTLDIGTLAAAGAAIFFAITNLLTRKLTRTQSLTEILVYLTATQVVFGLVCAGYDGDIALPDLQTGPWLVLIGIAGLCAHLCLTTALTLALATIVMPMDFARLPLIAVVGWAVYGEALELAVLAGAAIIICANLLNLRASAGNRAGNIAKM
ncbi:DMT family transporter [Aestuariibius insulae]|uniref:DMT family transporter n=1 Tax=Aestuariibius insulae TaxID=2058287 RepID=UPI00345E166D